MKRRPNDLVYALLLIPNIESLAQLLLMLLLFVEFSLVSQRGSLGMRYHLGRKRLILEQFFLVE